MSYSMSVLLTLERPWKQSPLIRITNQIDHVISRRKSAKGQWTVLGNITKKIQKQILPDSVPPNVIYSNLEDDFIENIPNGNRMTFISEPILSYAFENYLYFSDNCIPIEFHYRIFELSLGKELLGLRNGPFVSVMDIENRQLISSVRYSKQTVSLDMSPYIQQEYCTLNEHGEFFLYDIKQEKMTKNSFESDHLWKYCQFAMTPRCFWIASAQEVYFLDSRSKSHKQNVVASLDYSFKFAANKKDPFTYVLSSLKETAVYDHRYPVKPMHLYDPQMFEIPLDIQFIDKDSFLTWNDFPGDILFHQPLEEQLTNLRLTSFKKHPYHRYATLGGMVSDWNQASYPWPHLSGVAFRSLSNQIEIYQLCDDGTIFGHCLSMEENMIFEPVSINREENTSKELDSRALADHKVFNFKEYVQRINAVCLEEKAKSSLTFEELELTFSDMTREFPNIRLTIHDMERRLKRSISDIPEVDALIQRLAEKHGITVEPITFPKAKAQSLCDLYSQKSLQYPHSDSMLSQKALNDISFASIQLSTNQHNVIENETSQLHLQSALLGKSVHLSESTLRMYERWKDPEEYYNLPPIVSGKGSKRKQMKQKVSTALSQQNMSQFLEKTQEESILETMAAPSIQVATRIKVESPLSLEVQASPNIIKQGQTPKKKIVQRKKGF